MAYLIPRSMRNVKFEVFRNIGLIESFMIVVAIVIGLLLLIYLNSINIFFRIVIVVIIAVLTLFLISPSFIVNKKGYQTFGIVFTYLNRVKVFERSE